MFKGFFNYTIEKALRIISNKNLGIGIIVKNKNVIGIVTDGDIRRGSKNYQLPRGGQGKLILPKQLYRTSSASGVIQTIALIDFIRSKQNTSKFLEHEIQATHSSSTTVSGKSSQGYNTLAT